MAAAAIFDVPDLKDTIVLAGKPDKFGRLIGIIGHRLFDEHMPALLEQYFGEVEMRDSWRDDAERVGCGCGFAERLESSYMVFFRKLLCGLRRDIINADKVNLTRRCHVGINARVFFAERPDAQHRNLDR